MESPETARLLGPMTPTNPGIKDSVGAQFEVGRSGGERLAQAMAKLASLHDLYAGISETVGCGPEAIPALRRFLFQQDRSGLYQTRCGAVEALAALGAFSVLLDYLNQDRRSGDAIADAGEEAVLNAAARALGAVRYEAAFPRLLRLSVRRSLSGVIEALGQYGRGEAIPILVDALGEDASRVVAENALLGFGAIAASQLIDAARMQGRDDAAARAKRRRALRVLAALDLNAEVWEAVKPMIEDGDDEIAYFACKIGLQIAPKGERGSLCARLNGLLRCADWRLSIVIEDTLRSAAC